LRKIKKIYIFVLINNFIHFQKLSFICSCLFTLCYFFNWLVRILFFQEQPDVPSC